MPGRVEFEFTPEPQPVFRGMQDLPMRILVLGDFSGRANRGLLDHGVGLAERPVTPVDVDNFEDVLFRFAPRLHLPAGDPSGPGMAVELKQLEDFHPDALYENLELFRALRERRRRLEDPTTFREEAAELKRWAAEKPAGQDSEPPAEDDASTLERLLGKRPAEPSQPGPLPAAALDVSRLIKNIVEPYVVPGADPQQAQLVSAVDTTIGDQMRAALHHPAFQELESLWRSVHGLITGLETGEELKVYVLDVTKHELAADTSSAGGDLQASGLQRALVERDARTPGGQPWSVLVGYYSFGNEAGDLALLGRLGAIASQAGGPFLAAADPRILGCASLAETPDPENWKVGDAEAEQRWQAFRASPVASWIGLALPRVLLRLPYGKKTDEIDRFEFEELSIPSEHEAYLWGNPAVACALLIGRAFQERGWSMQPGDYLDVENLPAHIDDDDGESRMKPCAEAQLGERAGTAILNRGLMPLLSYRDRNAARVMRFQSVADPPAALPGPWS